MAVTSLPLLEETRQQANLGGYYDGGTANYVRSSLDTSIQFGTALVFDGTGLGENDTIDSATLSVRALNTSNDSPLGKWYAHEVLSPSALNNADQADVWRRTPLTSPYTVWDGVDVGDTAYVTVNVTAVIQAIVRQPGWDLSTKKIVLLGLGDLDADERLFSIRSSTHASGDMPLLDVTHSDPPVGDIVLGSDTDRVVLTNDMSAGGVITVAAARNSDGSVPTPPPGFGAGYTTTVGAKVGGLICAKLADGTEKAGDEIILGNMSSGFREISMTALQPVAGSTWTDMGANEAGFVNANTHVFAPVTTGDNPVLYHTILVGEKFGTGVYSDIPFTPLYSDDKVGMTAYHYDGLIGGTIGTTIVTDRSLDSFALIAAYEAIPDSLSMDEQVWDGSTWVTPRMNIWDGSAMRPLN